MKYALIPARKGSKRFPGKNTSILNGKPLIVYTIDAVINSKIFDEIIVSSDDPKVCEITKAYQGITLHRRPDELATDTVTTSQVLMAILQERKIKSGICSIFLPTTPFRTAKHICEAFIKLKPNVNSVISICDFHIPPEFSMRYKDGGEYLCIPKNSPLRIGKTQSQTQSKSVHPNGAIYIAEIEEFLKTKSFFMDRAIGYLMDRISSIDIDIPEDMLIAKAIGTIDDFL